MQKLRLSFTGFTDLCLQVLSKADVPDRLRHCSDMRMRSTSRLLILLVLVSIVSTLAVTPRVNATGTLSGQVLGLYMNNPPILLYQARVTIYANGTQIRSIPVDGFDATYSVELPPAFYVVTAECPGFTAQSKTVGISNWHSTNLDFYLQRAPTTSGSTTTLLPLSVALISPPSPSNDGTVTSNSVTLQAQVTSGGAVQNADVAIYVDGNLVSSGFSDSNGYYSISYSLTQTGHVYSWYATASKSGYSPVASSTLTFSYLSQSVTSTTPTSTTTSYMATTTTATTTTSITTTTTLSLSTTIVTTLVFTNYTFTSSGTTTITSTQTAMVGSTSTVFSIPTTTPDTTTVSNTVTSYSIPLIPSCLIATAAYGSPLSPQVQALRSFRDGLVLKTFAGSQFMKAFNAWYYSFSPSVAPIVSNWPSLAAIVRTLIYPLLGILQVAASAHTISDCNSELGVTIAGLLASCLIGLVYHTPWITALLIAARKKRHFEMKLRYLVPFLGAWIASLIMIGIAGFFIAPLLMMLATAAFVLLTLGLSATVAATLITRKLG